ncbi:MAG: hypothetical protein HYT29_02360 [Parcubacteria group bacterium]|nr:hypothetical protein [Parcubacteria group bacterium]
MSFWPLVALVATLFFLVKEGRNRTFTHVQSGLDQIRAAEPESFDSTQDKSVFKMTDGYFLAGAWGQPIHLMHGPVEKQRAWLGDDLHFTIKLTLKKDAENPCSDRDEKPCEAELGLTNSTDDSCLSCVKYEFRIGDDRLVSLGLNGQVSRKQPYGESRFFVRVKKDGRVLFLYEIPVEIL